MPNPVTRPSRDDIWGFANAQGDPNGNMSYAEAQRWAENFARLNPGWTGNSTFTIDPRTGKAQDTRSWLARNGWIFPVIAGAGIALGPMLAGGGGAGGAGASGASGSLAPIAGGSPWAVTPYASTAMSVPTGAAAVGGTVGLGGGVGGPVGGGGVLSGMFKGLTARDLAALGLTGVGAIGGAMQDRPDFSPNTGTTDPNIQRLLQTMQGRLDKSEPLYDSIMAMTNGLLPTQYQKGGGGGG